MQLAIRTPGSPNITPNPYANGMYKIANIEVIIICIITLPVAFIIVPKTR